jgi:hypothetical protein
MLVEGPVTGATGDDQVYYVIWLPLALACTSPNPARTTRCTTAEAHTRSRRHTGCADADPRQADAPQIVGGRATVGHESKTRGTRSVREK